MTGAAAAGELTTWAGGGRMGAAAGELPSALSPVCGPLDAELSPDRFQASLSSVRTRSLLLNQLFVRPSDFRPARFRRGVRMRLEP